MSNSEDKQEAERAKLRATVKQSLETTDWQLLRDVYCQQAKTMKLRYDAAVMAGFSKIDALQLCRGNW